MLYDNGDFRAMPFNPPVRDANNYSRAVEYQINEQAMEVSQVWDYGRTNVAERLYTPHRGSAYPLPKTENVLIAFPAVSYVNGVPPSPYGPDATMARIQEVTHDPVPQIVFDLAISVFDKTNSPYKECSIYRCLRIPDLYAHLPKPVVDVSVHFKSGAPLLEFSADDARTYVIQTSTNLVNWEQIGTATEDSRNSGLFEFQDPSSAKSSTRYYRIVTQ